MMIFLKCNSPQGTQQLVLRAGERARVGSSEWMELSISDRLLQPEHFVIDCRGPLKLICSPQCTVEIAGEPYAQIELVNGTTFGVGSCEFEVATQGEIEENRASSLSAPKSESIGQIPWWSDVQWEVVDTASNIIEQLKQLPTAREAVTHLMHEEQVPAALRLVASLLSPKNCVCWASQAIETVEEIAASVQAWLAVPDEAHRREVQLTTELDSPADWIAQAVNWTGGSLAPDDAPPVPPSKSLCGIACATAIQLHLASGRASCSLEQVLDSGLKVLQESRGLLRDPSV